MAITSRRGRNEKDVSLLLYSWRERERERKLSVIRSRFFPWVPLSHFGSHTTRGRDYKHQQLYNSQGVLARFLSLLLLHYVPPWNVINFKFHYTASLMVGIYILLMGKDRMPKILFTFSNTYRVRLYTTPKETQSAIAIGKHGAFFSLSETLLKSSLFNILLWRQHKHSRLPTLEMTWRNSVRSPN